MLLQCDSQSIKNGKKILILSNTASMIVQFNMNNLYILKRLGYKIEIACNFIEGNTCTIKIIQELKNTLKNMDITCHQIDFARGFRNVKNQFTIQKQVERLFKSKSYDVVFCQSTIAGVMGRIYGKKYSCKVIYIAHGFQFYSGASKIRWITFYTLEKILSKLTDLLIVINEDDYKLAKKCFMAKRIMLLPGVGIDIRANLLDKNFDKNNERRKMNLEEDDFVILSVGELSRRKNHKMVIDLIYKMKNKKIKYLICGIGNLEKEYRDLIKKRKLENQVFLLGYQTELKNIYGIADVFCLTSFYEGLPVCLLTAIATGTVSICSDIRGNHELVRDKNYLFNPKDPKDLERCIKYVMKNDNTNAVENNLENLKRYDSHYVNHIMGKVFRGIV